MQENSAGQDVLAIDIGGTKIAAAIVSVDGTIRYRQQIPTATSAGPDVLFSQLEGLVRRVLDVTSAWPCAVGAGCGGPMRYPEGEVSPVNIPAWRGFPLKARLEGSIGLPCFVDNDAKAFALGEWLYGSGSRVSHLLGMVVSTGVGGGIVVDGHLVHGARGNAGHIGHTIVVPGGPLCGCGTRGCLEAVASGTGIARRWADARGSNPDGSTETAGDIARAARDRDPLAVHLFEEAGEGLARGIASAAALLDLERVVLGGSVASHAWDLLDAPLRAELARSSHLDFTRGLRVERASLPDSAGLLGAAALATQIK